MLFVVIWCQNQHHHRKHHQKKENKQQKTGEKENNTETKLRKSYQKSTLAAISYIFIVFLKFISLAASKDTDIEIKGK